MRRRDAVKAGQWQERLKDWHASGVSQKSYCQEHELNIHTFKYWLKRLGSPQSTERSLVPVHVLSSPHSSQDPEESGLSLKAGEFQVLIKQGFDASTLRQLLSVIRSC